MPVAPSFDLLDRQWDVNPSAQPVDVIPGVTVPRRVTASGPADTVPGSEHETHEARLAVEARLDERRGCYLLAGLTVSVADDEVTGTLLRTIAPLTILRWVIPRTFRIDHEILSPAVLAFVAPELEEERERRADEAATIVEGKAELGEPISDDLQREAEQPPPTLEDAVTVHRLAELVREPPGKAVTEALGISRRTATNWITRAREQGLI